MSFVQTKTSQGFIPFRGVMLRDDGMLEFDALSARDLMSAEPSRRAMMSSPASTKDLIDLALCSPSAESSDAQRAESMLYAFAQWSGPLFGSSHIESLRAWKYAADVAMLATRFQECANGSKPISALKALGRVHKQRVINSATGVSFDEFDVAIAVCGEYRDVVSKRPVIRRTEDADGVCYVSVARYEEDDLAYLEFVAIRLAEDRDSADLQELMWDAGIVDGEGALVASTLESDRYSFEELELCAGDLPAIAALLRAIVSAHLDGVHVDAFADYGATGNLFFECFLAWLWYDFSRRLSRVSIGYCEQCGKPFSLVGHRGAERRYCSRQCKTDAKNARSKADREASRRMSLQGASVAEIARELYPTMDSERAAARVRADLSKWVELKHRIDDQIAEVGLAQAELLRRCAVEGLDVKRLVSAQRLKQFKRKQDAEQSS